MTTQEQVRLTGRQQHILVLASHGYTRHETAVELGIGEETVRSHRRRILQLLEARTMTEAVAKAFQQGLLR